MMQFFMLLNMSEPVENVVCVLFATLIVLVGMFTLIPTNDRCRVRISERAFLLLLLLVKSQETVSVPQVA